MKVTFKIIKTGSGNDIYFQRLAEALKKVNIASEIKYYSKIFQYFPALLKLINRSSDADIIHSNAEYGWVFKERNKPLVVSCLHDVFDKNYQKSVSLHQKIYHNFVLKQNIKKTLKTADKLLAISKFTQKAFREDFQTKKIKLLYCPVNIEKYKPTNKISSKNDKFSLLFVGNLTKRKGADLLPKIMKMLGNEYMLYFTSGLRSDIPEEFNLSNLKPLGKLSEDDLINEYRKCDALLFPSRLEGFGYSAAEALSCGKPVIGSDYSSIPEIVRDGVNGFLCKVNDINCFSKKIRELKNATKTANKLGLKGREYIIKNFSEIKIAKEYQNLIS